MISLYIGDIVRKMEMVEIRVALLHAPSYPTCYINHDDHLRPDLVASKLALD